MYIKYKRGRKQNKCLGRRVTWLVDDVVTGLPKYFPLSCIMSGVAAGSGNGGLPSGVCLFPILPSYHNKHRSHSPISAEPMYILSTQPDFGNLVRNFEKDTKLKRKFAFHNGNFPFIRCPFKFYLLIMHHVRITYSRSFSIYIYTYTIIWRAMFVYS